DLVGGVQTVTLTDEEARLRGTQKTVSERKAPPTFDTVVEIIDRDLLVVHPDAAAAVDALLRGRSPGGIRRRARGEPIEDHPAPAPAVAALRRGRWPGGIRRGASGEPIEAPPAPPRPVSWSRPARTAGRQTGIYVYALSRDLVERALRDLRLEARTVVRPERADMVIAQRARAEDPRLQRSLEHTGMPFYTVKKNRSEERR